MEVVAGKLRFACKIGRVRIAIVSLLAGAALAPFAAQAQQTADRQDPHPGQVVGPAAPGADANAIVVTARFREESLQDIPDSIVALTGEALEQRNITGLQNLTYSLPNVGVSQALNPGSLFINMRGINTFRGSEPGVAVRIDGVQATSAEQLSQDLVDIERIEVLKGPQGALYGRNALVGAINVVTRRPGNESRNRVRAGYGNGDDYSVDASFSGPIVSDKLFYGLSGSYNNFGGVIKDGFIDRPVDFRESTVFRGRLVWTPDNSWTVDARYTFDDLNGGTYYFVPIVDETVRPIRDAADRFNLPIRGDVLTVDNRRFNEAALNVDYSPEFGGVFKYIFAYHHLKESYGVPGTGKGGFVDRGGNLDILEFPILANAQYFKRRSINNELRYVSDDSSLFRYVVGIQYVDQTLDDQLPVFAALNNLAQYTLNAANGDPLIQGLSQDDPFIALGGADTRRDVKALGLYAQTNLDLTDSLELTLAYRYDRERRSRLDNNTGGSGKQTFAEHQPKVSLAWTAPSGTLVYATVAKGFRSGGFNKTIDPNDPTDFSLVFQSEILWSYEIGVKASLLGGDLTFNSAIFYEDVKNHQEFAFQPLAAGQIVYNIPKMEIYGVEAELKYEPTNRLQLSASLGLLDSEIKRFDGIEAGFGRAIDAVGNQAPGVDHWKYTVSAQYTIPLGTSDFVAQSSFTQSGDLQWFIDGLNRAPSRELLQANLTWRKNGLELSVWGTNLLDDDWYSSYEPSTQTGLVADIAYPTQGRRYGVKAAFKF